MMNGKMALVVLSILVTAALASNVTVTKTLVRCTSQGNCTGVPATSLYVEPNDYVQVLVTVSNTGTTAVGGMMWDSAPQALEYVNGTIATDADLNISMTGRFANAGEATTALGPLSGYMPTEVVNQTIVSKFPGTNQVISWGVNPQSLYQFVPIPPGYNKTFSYLLRVTIPGTYSLDRAYFVSEITGLELLPGFYETTFCSYPGGSVEQRFIAHSQGTNLTNVLITQSPVTIGGLNQNYVTFNVTPTFIPSIIPDGLATFTGIATVAPGTPKSADPTPYVTTLYASADQVPASIPLPVYIRVKDCNLPGQSLDPSIITNPRNVTIKAYPPENVSVQFRIMNTGRAAGKVLVSAPSCGGALASVTTPVFLNPSQVGIAEAAYNFASATNCSGNVNFTLQDAAGMVNISVESIPINVTSYPVLPNASIQFVNCTSGVQFPESSYNNYTNVYNFSVSRAKSETVFCANNNGNVTLTDVQMLPYPLLPPTAVRWSFDGSNYSDTINSLPTANTVYVKLITDGQDAQQGAYNITYMILANGATDTIASTVTLTPVPAALTLVPSAIPALPCSQAVTVTNPGNEVTDLTVTPYGVLANYLDVYPRYEKAYLGASASAGFNVSFDSYRCKLDGNGTCSASSGGLNITYDGKSNLLSITSQNIDCAINNTNLVATALSNAYLSKGETAYVLKTPAAVETIDQNSGTTLSITFSGSSSKSVTVFLNGFNLGAVQMNGTQVLPVTDASMITYTNGGTNVVSLKSYEDVSTINVNVTNVTLGFNTTTPAFYITPTMLFLILPPGGGYQRDFTIGNRGGGIISAITLSMDAGRPGEWITIPSTMEDLGPGGGLPTERTFTMNLNLPNDTSLINQTFSGVMYAKSRVGWTYVYVQIRVVDPADGSDLTVIPYDENTNVTLENMSVFISTNPTGILPDLRFRGMYTKALAPLEYRTGDAHAIEVNDPNQEYAPARTSVTLIAGTNIVRVPMHKGKILSVNVSVPACTTYDPYGYCSIAMGQSYTITVKSTVPQLEYTIKYGFVIDANASGTTYDPQTGVYTSTIVSTCPQILGNALWGCLGPYSPTGPNSGFIWSPCNAGQWSLISCSGGAVVARTSYTEDRGTDTGWRFEWPKLPATQPDPARTTAAGVGNIAVNRIPGVPEAQAPLSGITVTGTIREAYKQVTYVLVDSAIVVTASAYVDIAGESTTVQAAVTNTANISFIDPTVAMSARYCGPELANISSCGLKDGNGNPTTPTARPVAIGNISVGGNCTGEACLIGSSLTVPVGAIENVTIFANGSTELHRTIRALTANTSSSLMQIGYGASLGYYGIYAQANATLNNALLSKYSEQGYVIIRVVSPPRLVSTFSAPGIEQGKIVDLGQFFTVRATITNDAGVAGRTAHGVTVSLTRLENVEVVGTNIKSVGDLPTGGTATVEWTIRATRAAVSLLAEMRASSTEGAKTVALWTGVSKAKLVDLTLDPNYWDWGRLPACGSASKQFYMYNYGDVDLSVNYRRVTGYASTWISSSPSSMYIPSGGYAQLTLTVNIPCDIGPGHYSGIFEFDGVGRTLTTFTAPLRISGEVVSDRVQLYNAKADTADDKLMLAGTSNISCSDSGNATKNCTTAFDVGGASTSMPSSIAITAPNGISGDATVSITNKNQLLPSIDVSFYTSSSWLSFIPANLTMPQNATMNFVVRATLPSGTVPGTYYASIYALYNGTRDSSSYAGVTVPRLASISPTSIGLGYMLPGTSKSFQLNISNPSSVIVDAQLQFNDWVTYNQNSLTIAPAGVGSVIGTFSVPPGTAARQYTISAPVLVGGQGYSVPITVNVLPKYATQAFNGAITSFSQAYDLSGRSNTTTIYVQTGPNVPLNAFPEPSTAYITISPATGTPIDTSWFNMTTFSIPVPGSPGVSSAVVAINVPINAPAGNFYGIVTGYVSNGSSAFSLNQLYITVSIPTRLQIAPTSISLSKVDGDYWSGILATVSSQDPDYAFTGLTMRFYSSGSKPIDPAWFTSHPDGILSVSPSGSTDLPALVTIPANQEPGTYAGLMRETGTYQATGASVYFDVPISVTVRPKMTLAAGSLSLTVTDGTSATTSMTIYNNGLSGNLSSTLLSPATGYSTNPLPSSWVTYSANNFDIRPVGSSGGNSRTVNITVTVPLVTPSGLYTGYVNVTDSVGRLNTFLLYVTVPVRFLGSPDPAPVTVYDGETSATTNANFGLADQGTPCATVTTAKIGGAGPYLLGIGVNGIMQIINTATNAVFNPGDCVPSPGYYRVPFSVSIPQGTTAGTYKGTINIAAQGGINWNINVTIIVPQGITASVAPTVVTVQPGASQQVNATVNNLYYLVNGYVLNGTVDLSGGIAAWADNTSKAFTSLMNLPRVVNFLISVPPTQNPGAYTGTFTANSRQSYAVSNTINVPAVISMNITNMTANVYDAIPYTRDFAITDTNIQNTTVALSVSGLSTSLYSLNETSFVVNKGQTKAVRFTFNAPNQYSNGVYTGTLSMTESVSGKVINVPLNFTLNNSLDMTPTRIFSEQVPDTPVVSQYSVKNNANVPLTVNMTIEPTTSSPLNLSWASGYSVTAVIPAGATYLYNVTVTLPAEAIGYYTGRVRLTTAYGHSRISELIVKSAIDMILDVC